MFNATDEKHALMGQINVATASLDTGIPLRDEHLQSGDWLNAAQNPHISFEVTKARLPRDLLAVRATFPVKLRDFGIKGFDGVVGQKVNDTIEVDVRFVVTNVSKENSTANPCNPCGPRKS